jgi:RimJ/RimL family protein N-acetyltransferase
MEIKFQDIIVGDNIILRKTSISDAQDVFNWRSGLSGKYMRQPEGYSVKSQGNWIKSRGIDEINYIILDKITKKKVGTIGIYDINTIDRIANVGRLLLSDEFLGKSNPYGLEALLLGYDYVLNKMDFRKITGDILATNKAMFKLQKFLGMKQEGYLEKHTLINGNFEDLFIMSICKEQFNDTYKKKINFLLKSFK